jgi:TonB family protein
MSRLQKKCFIGATGFHLLLLAILIVGPVFLSPGESDPTPMLEFVPVDTTEAQVSGGGNPRPPTPTPPAPQPQPQPQVQPQIQQPAPQPPPQREPDPPKVEKVKEAKPDPDSLEPKPDKKVHQVKVSDKVIKVPRDLKTPPKPAADDTAAATARANAERKEKFAAALKNISSGLTSSTTIEMPDGPNGPGGGGASYASYKDEVRRIYFEAWRIPDDLTDDEATVKVSVTIARAGHVISSRILQSSGSKLVDKSIQATLDRVTFVRAFPDGSKDSQKTFNISFSLKAKKLG